ncbi:MAG: hypothetical protein ACP5E2_11075, partial [Terracidiphilus sp.]
YITRLDDYLNRRLPTDFADEAEKQHIPGFMWLGGRENAFQFAGRFTSHALYAVIPRTKNPRLLFESISHADLGFGRLVSSDSAARGERHPQMPHSVRDDMAG